MQDNINILFVGIGGQGVLKASEIAGLAGVFAGYKVKKSEVHGMSQRGGSVESHLRIGRRIYSPLIPKGRVDFLVGFDKNEAQKARCYLKKGGLDLSEKLDLVLKELKNYRSLNICFLGMLSCSLPIKEENWLKAIREEIKKEYLDLNLEAFYLGRKIGGGV
ncbi:MAG: pyruvate ferredoxin oxidoreductase [Candidatus Omnitrophota bacterium]|nr:MAG: pyruvate ferredoxin oxidoreductase [Candidatus Omnitrophota bacterium]